MKLRKAVLSAVAVLAVLFGANATSQGIDSLDPDNPTKYYNQCMGVYGMAECQASAGPQGAAHHEAPDSAARVLAQIKYGQFVPLLEPASKLAGAEWVPTYVAVAGPRGPYTRVAKAWVRRAEVVLNTDFRRVVGCWPISFAVIPEEGIDEHPGWVNFTVKGVASARIAGQLPAQYGVQHTYFAQGIFTVRHASDLLHDYFVSGTLDYEGKVVKYLGETVLKQGKQVRWFGAKELEGCKEIPTVDDTRVPKQRWPEKERGG